MKILILFLNNEIRTGGHRRFLDLMESLAEGGHKVEALLNRDLDYEPRAFSAQRVECRYRRGQLEPLSRTFARAARRALSLLAGPDFIIVFGESHLPAGAIAAKGLGAPLLYGHRSNTVREALIYLEEPGHGLKDKLKTRLALSMSARWEKRIADLADVAVFQSPYDLEDFASRTGKRKAVLDVVKGNIGGPRFSPVLAKANASVAVKKLVFVGTLGQRKGLKYLLKALRLLAERGIVDLSLDVIGPGVLEGETKAAAEDPRLAGRLRFHGKVADAVSPVAAADLAIIPALFDSYPDTVLEALHVGTPVLGSAVGGIPDMLRHEDLLFPPMDGKALADRIERAVEEPGFYARLRSLCAERRDAFLFDWPAEWVKVMERHLAAKR